MRWNNACEAYWWVYEHPKMLYQGSANPWIEITPHVVDDTKTINDDQSKNVNLEWWVECGPYVDVEDFWGEGPKYMPSHDWELDCGGNTAEEAILNLARLVLEKYGDY